jgi:hypothetical protein
MLNALEGWSEMRTLACLAVITSSLCWNSAACVAQQGSGPATLESLVNAGDAQEAPTTPEAEASDSGPNRPAGTVTRPKDGVQHPDLNDAWAEYDETVAKAAESIKAAITKQFDAAAAEGDLDAAEKWQAVLEKFEKTGDVPVDAEAKATVSVAAANYKKAKEELIKAYEAVVKALTMEKNIADAKAVRDEARAIMASSKALSKAVAAAGEAVDKKLQADSEFLCNLGERDVIVGYGTLGKGDQLGYEGRVVRVQGVLYSKSISMHPYSNGLAKVTFDVPKGVTHFEAQAAINDGARQATPLKFKVFGGTKLLWASRPLYGAGSKDDCSIALKGVKTISLVVECPGQHGGAWAVWCDPQFTKR